VSTTVVNVVGAQARAITEAVGAAANVRAVIPDHDEPPLERAVDAWRQVVGAHVPYLVHDADALAEVAVAWVAWYDRTGARGELEVAVAETVTRWRARALELPDYYLVLDAESLPPTWRHWYLGFLHRAAPARVVPVVAEAATVLRRLSRLGAGRWWPDLSVLLDDVDRVVPDRLGVDSQPGAGQGQASGHLVEARAPGTPR
jgi:hypothetical protein